MFGFLLFNILLFEYFLCLLASVKLSKVSNNGFILDIEYKAFCVIICNFLKSLIMISLFVLLFKALISKLLVPDLTLRIIFVLFVILIFEDAELLFVIF